VLIVLFTVVSPNNVFFSALNARNLLLGGTELLLLTLAIAMLLGGGLLDLSLGANLVLSSVVGAMVMQAVVGPVAPGTNPPNVATAVLLGLLACIVTGVLFGLVNGFIVAYLEVNSLIGTLGTLGIGTGVALIITRGADIPGLPNVLQTGFGLRTIAGIAPLPALLAIVIAIILWAVLRFTRFGLHVLAMGSSRLAVDRAGLNVRLQLLYVAMLAGALAGFAGFVDLSRYLSTSVNGHSQDGLAAITAAVIGGTVLGGGRVSIAGSIWGTVLAQVLLGGLVVIGVASFYQLVVIGAVLIAAVAVDRYRFKQREAR
jgi:ribose transport system permease protein